LIVSSASAVVIGLTWGGVTYPWSSPHVIVPLVLGLLGVAGFFYYERTFAEHPIVSEKCFRLVSRRAVH